MKSLFLACGKNSETQDPLLVNFGHQIVVFWLFFVVFLLIFNMNLSFLPCFCRIFR